ncbi:MAG TPA: bifunctional diguanylate cyclase/phosphodiesterase, partial [Acidimicrobiales bacterium]
AIWIYSGRPTPEALRRALVTGEIFGFVNAVLGVGVVASLWRDPLFALPLVAGALLLYLLYRAHIRLSQRYDSLETLHGFTEEVSGSLDLDVVSGRVLASARALLRCEQADLLLLDPGGDHAVLYSDADGDVTSAAVADEHARKSVEVALPTGKARLVDVKQGVPVWLSDAPLKDLIAAPIMFDQTTVGLMTVVNRLTPVSTFGPEDVRLLETLANQAGVALENSRLFGRLQDEASLRTHQALHDGLTGLPNRQLLMERLIAALGDARRDGHKVAVLYLDLEGFKDINDTLGHQAGDVVLRHVCDRIGHNLPHGATLARFGGDEFVVLLPRCYDQDQAMRVGGAILESLVSPFTMQDLNVAVGAGIGIALFPDHATDPTTLLQRADVAMDSAKAVHGGLEIYAAERDPFTPQRLALAGELRQAIGRREIEVYYQPKVSATTGVVLGAEALVRWRHPNHGLLMPDQFIPAAERSSVIHLLTQHVLGTALESCRLWRASGLDLSVSVNLSMRDLLDPRLPGDVLDLLVHYGVPAEALVLELTESSAMTEARRTMGILSQLKEMGIKVSIDDFGTGYSSLTYLRRLPISELKVDRQFVMNLTFDRQDAAIVQTTVELGKRLNLTVVAEGVENQETADELARYGCDLLQGFFVSRPLPARTFDAWLQRRPTRSLTV